MALPQLNSQENLEAQQTGQANLSPDVRDLMEKNKALVEITLLK